MNGDSPRAVCRKLRGNECNPPKWEGAWTVKERALWLEQWVGNEQRGDDGGVQGILERRVDFSKVTQQD